ALDPAADRSCAAPQLSFKADSAGPRSNKDSAVSERCASSHRIFWAHRLRNLSAGRTHGGMAPENARWFRGTATQALAGKEIGSASHAGNRGNRKAGFNECAN